MKTICNKQNNIFNIIRGYLIIGVVLIMIFTNTAPVNAGIGIGTDIGDIKETNIVTSINGNYIPSFNIDGNTVIMCLELDNYGFTTSYDSNERIVRISYDRNKGININSGL